MPYRFVELLPKEFEKFEQQHALGTYTQSIVSPTIPKPTEVALGLATHMR